jgi:hypothetical protein
MKTKDDVKKSEVEELRVEALNVRTGSKPQPQSGTRWLASRLLDCSTPELNERSRNVYENKR